MRKHTFPSSNMNGNVPVRSLYIVPVCLSANAAKQYKFALSIIFAISSSSITIRCRANGSSGPYTCRSPGASNALTRSFHMSLSCGRAWIEIFCDPMRREIGAPIEVPAPKCFEKGRYFWTTE